MLFEELSKIATSLAGCFSDIYRLLSGWELQKNNGFLLKKLEKF